MSAKQRIIIEGITESGETFRPSDWADRMSGQLSTWHKQRLQYSPLLQPSMKNGHHCVIVDPALKETNPELYQTIMQFAKTNQLKICSEIVDEQDSQPE